MKVVASTLNAKFIHMCLSIRYLKAYAQPEFDIELAEYTINDPEMNIVSDLHEKKPDVLGFSCYIWNIEETIKVIKMMKKISPDLTVVLGGPEVTYDTAMWMEKVPEVDYIVIGEGEARFTSLLKAIRDTEPVSEIDGLAYRENGQVQINHQKQKLELKEIPTPYRFTEDIPDLSKRVIYLETSRGCPFTCQFCLSSIEVGVRYFDREKIKEDILYLMEHGAKTIKFVDRTFNISRSYAMEMFQFIIDRHYPGTVFQFEITADIMRPEVIEFLNENAPEGLIRFEIGVQSTNDFTNELVKRNQNFKKLARTVTLVKDGGKIVQHLDLIAGLPEEDYSSFRKTFNDVFEFEPEELQLGFLKMLRGTGLRNNAAEYGYEYMDHAPYEMLANRVMPFDDIVSIKQVEDVLDKYWNDHRMDATIRYIVQNTFDSAFDFFQEFGSYWNQKGWSRIGHQLEDLFKRLYLFLQDKKVEQLPAIESLMKYDYLRNKKQKPRKSWWDDIIEKQTRSDYITILAEKPELLGEQFTKLKLLERDMHKHTIMEVLPFNMEHFFQTGELLKEDTLFMIYYDPKSNDNPIFFKPTLSLNKN